MKLKRAIIILVVVSLTASFIALPASAAVEGDQFVDILPAASYTRVVNYNAGQEFTKPFAFCDNASRVTYTWDATVYDEKFTGFYITVTAAVKPDVVQIKQGSTIGPHECTYLGGSGNIFQYYVPNEYNINEFTVLIYYWSPVSCNVGILSVRGVRNSTVPINTCSYMFRTSFVNEAGVMENAIRDRGSNVSLPVDCFWGTDDLFGGDLFLWVGPKHYTFQDVDSITFILHSSGPLLDYVGASIVDDNDEVVAILPDELLYTQKVELVNYWDKWPYYTYEVTIDLSEVKFSGYWIQLAVALDPASYRDNGEQIGISCTSIFMTLPDFDTPWYQVFWNWLTDRLGNLQALTSSAIASAGNRIVTFMDLAKDAIVHAINGDRDDMAAAGEFEDSVSDQASELDQMNQAMQVEKPDPGSISADVNALVPGGVAPAGNVLAVVTNNSTVSTMLLLVVTIALVGYVFFGKKG